MLGAPKFRVRDNFAATEVRPPPANIAAILRTAGQELFTRSGGRLRQRSQRPGDLNWLLLAGGPGIGSESLHELAGAPNVPGSIWMVDLPGGGSNLDPPGAPADTFFMLADGASPIYVRRSTGGMYLLSTLQVEEHIAGLAS